jgi:Superfamily II DNA and RNA helicases
MNKMRGTKATIALPSFSELKLLPELVSVLSSMNITKASSIQAQAIPSLLSDDSHHIIAAQTGTGKTLTYTLPLFQLLKQQEILQNKALTFKNSPRGIIIVPNRELSRQCELVLSKFKHEVRLKTFSSYSGQK